MTEPIEVGQVWRGRNHGSLFKVLAADGGRVTFLVMHMGNDYLAEDMPPGSIVTRPVTQDWHDLMEYAPEWNEKVSQR